jgi:hypothetical protein
MDGAMSKKSNTNVSAELFIEVSRLLHRKPVDDVMPVLITAVARALVLDGEGDMKKLSLNYLKFCNMVHEQMGDMIAQDLSESERATK